MSCYLCSPSLHSGIWHAHASFAEIGMQRFLTRIHVAAGDGDFTQRNVARGNCASLHVVIRWRLQSPNTTIWRSSSSLFHYATLQASCKLFTHAAVFISIYTYIYTYIYILKYSKRSKTNPQNHFDRKHASPKTKQKQVIPKLCSCPFSSFTSKMK